MIVTMHQKKVHKKYTRIVRLLVESSTLYSLSVLVLAISGFMSTGDTSGIALVAYNYIETIVVIAAVSFISLVARIYSYMLCRAFPQHLW